MNTGEIEWPEAEAFKPLVKRPPKPKAAKAPVTVSVSEKGIVTLSLAPEVQQAFLSRMLSPKELQPVHVAFVATEERVALRISGGGGGAYTLRGAMKANSTGTPQRASLPLGKCGGIEFVSRAATDVTHKFGGGDLFVAIPIYHEAEDADDANGEGAEASPPPAGRVELASAATLAIDAALKAWPVKIDRDAMPLKVAAAVALIECDFPLQLVRAHLDLEHVILPAREDMKPNGMAAATAALEVLREAMED